MPGVLIVEAMAQAAALFSFTDADGGLKCDGKTAYYLVGIDDARFRRPVVPGDQLRLEVEALRLSRSICKYQARATVDGQEVAAAASCAPSAAWKSKWPRTSIRALSSIRRRRSIPLSPSGRSA